MDELVKRATRVPKDTNTGVGAASAATTIALAANGDAVVNANNNNNNNNNNEFVSEELLRPIRSRCRSDAETGGVHIREAARYLLLNLQHKSSIVRIRTLNVIDSLFVRCKLFRELMCEQIREIANCGALLSVGSAAHQSSSYSITYTSGARARVATGQQSQAQQSVNDSAIADKNRVATRVKELIELWDMQYGVQLPRLRAMARYLRESLRVCMPNLRNKAEERAKQVAITEQAQHKVLALQMNRVMRETNAQLPLIDADVGRMDDFMELIFPAVESLANMQTPAPDLHLGLGTSQTQSEGIGQGIGKRKRLVISIGLRMEDSCRKRSVGNYDNDEDEDEDEDQQQDQQRGLVAGHSVPLDTSNRCSKSHNDKEDEEDNDNIDWEDDAATPSLLPTFAASATNTSISTATATAPTYEEMQELLAAVPPAGIQISRVATTASDIQCLDNADILLATRDHATHLARSCLPKVRGWLIVILQAQAHVLKYAQTQTQTQIFTAIATAPVTASDSSNFGICTQATIDSLSRRVALLNARLYRVLASAGRFFKEDFLNSSSGSNGSAVAVQHEE